VLTTGGDLAFYGTMDGWFRAVDDRSGKVLWQFKTASGIVGNPMTFTGPDGKQYVAIYSGIGGWMGATALPDISTDDPYAALGVVGAMKKIKSATQPGDMLYVFSNSSCVPVGTVLRLLCKHVRRSFARLRRSQQPALLE
jgi:outer membrane protein assembly factor BamB